VPPWRRSVERGQRVDLGTLGRLTAALETAVAEGKLVRNVAKLVKPPKKTEQDERECETWSQDHVRQLLATAGKERLHAAWRMSLYGLRRGEVLGLWWPVIDCGSFAETCTAHREKWCEPCYGVGKDYRPTTIRIEKTSVLVEYKVIKKDPKSRNGKRTLPLDPTPGRSQASSPTCRHPGVIIAGHERG
jgi:hypothetical protein